MPKIWKLRHTINKINKVMCIADVMTDPLEKVKELAITFS